MINVAINGAAGKMGREVVKAVSAEADLQLVAAVDKALLGADSGDLAGLEKNNISITDDFSALKQSEVVVDFTHPSVAMGNIKKIIDLGVNLVVGTTGISEEDIETIKGWLKGKDLGVLIAPNFAIGAILMMEFSKKAANYFSEVEIIELHHNQKADAPSGTALKTAQEISKVIKHKENKVEEKIILSGSRGGDLNDIHIHSVRLPGYVASQEVIFGGVGQTLKIRHDTIDRNSFMPGVVLAIREMVKRVGLIYGLEKLMDN